jgi:outer membrane immunogenic protein
MTIRSLFAALFFSLMALPVHAQDALRSEVAVGYTYVHTNAPPGGCGCFSMNGGSGSFGFHFKPGLTAVAEFGAVHASNVDSTGLDLTLTSFLFGPRVSHQIGKTRLVPYVQVLVGAVHASGGLAPSNSIGASSSTSFAATVGGGLDLKLTHHITLRPVQVEYFVTTLPNDADDHQNNLRVASSLVLKF